MRLFSTASKAPMLLFLYASVVLCTDPTGVLTRMQHKHQTDVEAWSLFTGVTDKNGAELYYALFFLSGKLFMISGNYVHYSKYEFSANKFTHESNAIVPPFGKVKHTTDALEEKLGKHSLRADSFTGRLTVTVDFKKLYASFSVIPQKSVITFRRIMGYRYAQRKFDWYIMPRCSVTVLTKSAGSRKMSGTGHFQQFWGEKGEANCDWIVVHTRSGYELVIARFPDEKKNLPWLPEDYILVSNPDGTDDKVETFTLSIKEWWESPASNTMYPLRYSVVSEAHDVDLTLTAFTENQTKKIAGKEFWNGFGEVSGTINGQLQEGWAYLAPLGKVVAKK